MQNPASVEYLAVRGNLAPVLRPEGARFASGCIEGMAHSQTADKCDQRILGYPPKTPDAHRFDGPALDQGVHEGAPDPEPLGGFLDRHHQMSTGIGCHHMLLHQKTSPMSDRRRTHSCPRRPIRLA